jgi:hypothetical protein
MTELRLVTSKIPDLRLIKWLGVWMVIRARLLRGFSPNSIKSIFTDKLTTNHILRRFFFLDRNGHFWKEKDTAGFRKSYESQLMPTWRFKFHDQGSRLIIRQISAKTQIQKSRASHGAAGEVF